MSTMSQYTLEALDKMLKRELIPIVLSLPNKIIEDNNVKLQEMHKYNDILLNFRLSQLLLSV